MNAEFKVVICGGCDRPTTAAVNGLCPQCFTRFNGKQRPMTDAEREQQRRSFAYGNVSLHNPDVTRELVDRVADEMTQESEPPMTQPPREVERTTGQIEIVGATHLVIFGEHGGNICSMSSPRRESSVEYHAAHIGDKDFLEAAANAEYIKLCWNSRAALVGACEEMRYIIEKYRDGEMLENFYVAEKLKGIDAALLAEKEG